MGMFVPLYKTSLGTRLIMCREPIPKFLSNGDCGIDAEVLKSMDGFGGGVKSRKTLCHRRKDVLGSINDGDSGGMNPSFFFFKKHIFTHPCL